MDPFMFLQFSFKKDAVRGLRIETRIRDQSPDPRVRPCTGTVKRRGTAQQRTTDPASASGSAFRTVQYAAAFSFALAHQNKAAGWPDPSPILGSGPSRTDPSHPGIAFARRAMPTMKGAVQEDDYRTEVRFKDKNPLKIKVLPPQVHKTPGSANCGSGTRIQT
jgi:hypothetical protein